MIRTSYWNPEFEVDPAWLDVLVDEVLSVGDQHFQDKCLAAIEERQQRGMTILMVSHQLDLIERFCGRSLYMSYGHLLDFGPTPDIIGRYQQEQ